MQMPRLLSWIRSTFATFMLVAVLTMSTGGCAAGRTGLVPDARAPEDIRRLIAAARDRVFPALVNIRVVTVRHWGGRKHKTESVGSGAIISKKGYVITNQHVTNSGKEFRCTLADKQEVGARLVGEDPLSDLAVLQLNIDELDAGESGLPIAHFGDSDALQVGELVMAMGSPFALARSVTLGIVSNPRRVFVGTPFGGSFDDMELMPGQRTGLFTRWIQHDALIHPGNSGGPLINLAGDIVGVNELGGIGMGFAIPSNLAKNVSEELIEKGEIARSWIGVSFKSIKESGLSRGVLIDSVVSDGPAQKAGLSAGDVLVNLQGDEVTARFPEQIPPLMKSIAKLPIGSSLSVAYLRNGKRIEASLETERFKQDRGEEEAFRAWGITAIEITDRLALEYRLEGGKGVLVTGVRPGGPAGLAEPPLINGDVIMGIGGQKIDDLTGFVERYNSLQSTEEADEEVLITFDRRGKNIITLLDPRSDELRSPPFEVRKAWIGVATQPVLRDLARRLGHPGVRGYRVTRVYSGTEAAKSDLETGDIIVALGGDKLVPLGMQDSGLMARAVRRLEIGKKAKLSVFRKGKMLAMDVTLEPTRITPQEASRVKDREMELIVREITFFDRDENHWGEEIRGVIVSRVEPGGPAALAGVRMGDVIQKIGDDSTGDTASYQKVSRAALEKKPEHLRIILLRGARTRVLFAEPQTRPVSAPGAGKKGSKEGK